VNKIKEIEKKNLLLRIYNIEKKRTWPFEVFLPTIKNSNYCIDAHTIVSYNHLSL